MVRLTIPFSEICKHAPPNEHRPSRWRYAPQPRDLIAARVDVAPRLSYHTLHRGRYFIRDALIITPTSLEQRVVGYNVHLDSRFERKDAPLDHDLLADHWRDFSYLTTSIIEFLRMRVRPAFELPKHFSFYPTKMPAWYQVRPHDGAPWDLPPHRYLAQRHYPRPREAPLICGPWTITADPDATYSATIHLPRRYPSTNGNVLAGINHLFVRPWHDPAWPEPYRPKATLSLELRKPYVIPGAIVDHEN